MEKTKRNQIIFLLIIIILMVSVVSLTAYSIFNMKRNERTHKTIELKQIYSSDYTLSFLDEKYIIGSYKDKSIDVIINRDGQEITTNNSIEYSNIYRLKDGRYLIYSADENTLKTYIFDGTTIKEYFTKTDIPYAKPIITSNESEEYIVGFYSISDSNLTIYDILSNEGITLNDCSFQAANIVDSIYYINNEKYLIIKNSNGLSGVIDFKGNIIIDYEYEDIISTKNDTFIALNDKAKYGIIGPNNEILVKFNYKVIKGYNDYYILVDSKNKMALYDKELNDITGFKMNYDSLIKYDLRNTDSINLTRLNGGLIISNNYLEDINGIEYSNHNLYIIKNNKIQETITEKGYFIDTILFTYNDLYEITLYDTNFDIVGTIKLEDTSKIDNIKMVSDNVVYIEYRDEKNNKHISYYTFDGEEITDKYMSYGTLISNNYMYHAFFNTDSNSLTVFDYYNEVSNTINGEKIFFNGEYLIIDNAIYKIIIS